jgi:hypothetical protein
MAVEGRDRAMGEEIPKASHDNFGAVPNGSISW